MNSWEIIRSVLITDTRPGSIGRHVEVDKCGKLFVALRHLLADSEIATRSLNEDTEVGEAILAQKGIKTLQDAGVL